MNANKIIWRKLFSVIVVVGILLPTGGWSAPLPAQGSGAAAMRFNGAGQTTSTGALFRTRVTFPDAASRARLDQLGVVVLDEGPDWALVLADGDQLEALARLHFEPQASDDLDVLVETRAQAKPWLAQSVQPLLTRAAAVRDLSSAGALLSQSDASTGGLVAAQDSLRTAMHALTAEQQAGIAALTSVDDDADGLTNTQEQWWCTDPLNADSDGDGTNDGDEVAALKAWLTNETSGPPATGKPFVGWPPNHTGCYDDDQDSIPDLAERWELGLNMNRESTDRDKFDDGQELFGNTYCPGSGGFCGYGALPRNEDWGVIFAEMPSWVEPPGNHPLVAAFPVPEIDVVESSLHMEAVTTVTTDHTINQGTEKSYSTSKMEGTSTSVADTVTWNEWQEASESWQEHVGVLALGNSSESRTTAFEDLKQSIIRAINYRRAQGIAKKGCKTTTRNWNLGLNLDLKPVGIGGGIEGGIGGETGLDPKYTGTRCRGALRQAREISPEFASEFPEEENRYSPVAVRFDPVNEINLLNQVVLNNSLDTDSIASGLEGVQYAYAQSGQLIGQRLYEIATILAAPLHTTTNTHGSSHGGAQTTTTEQYEEHTITNGEAFSSGESWSTATAVDSSHAADLWFTYHVRNTGAEYAREIGDLAFNVYIGDDPNPAYTYFVAPDVGGDGKFHNFMPAEEHTYTSRHIPLTLQQMAAVDLGGPVRIVVEDYSYGIDELFYEDAINAGVQIAMEDGTDDGDEAIDSYLIPTWGQETVLDVLARYFPHTTDADGNLIAIWTPEYRADTPAWCDQPNRVGATLWCKHALSTADWWNVYTDGLGDGSEGFQDTPAAPDSVALFRFNKDSDLDGYSDRSEARLGTDPDDPASHPEPELIAGLHSIQGGNHVTSTLSLLNTGLYDAYGVESVMISPDDSISVTNNTVGGSGRVRALHSVVVGSRIMPPSYDAGSWQGTAQPFSAGYYTGTADRIYEFTALDSGDVSTGTLRLQWDDGAGASGTLNLGTGYGSPTPLAVGSYGVKVGFISGEIQASDTFTVAARTPRDTFQYTVNSEPHTQPVVLVSYNDPQGNHRFVTPATLNHPTDDLMAHSGQMLENLGVEIVTQKPVTTTGAYTTTVVTNWPANVTLEDAHIFLEFVNVTGTVVSEVPVTVTLPSGPTVVPVQWSTDTFSPTFAPDEDYIVMVFWTDWQGNIIDTAARPLSSFQTDPKPAFAMADADATWDFVAAAQGTVLKRTFTFANTGFLDLLTYVSAPAGMNISQQGSRRVGPADVTGYEITLDTAGLPTGPYDETITIRTSDPENPARTVHVVGTITAGTPDTPPGSTQHPLDWDAYIAGDHSQGEWWEFTHTLGPDPQSLHPVKVYSQDYSTLWGVGKYATPFGQGTASYEMFGDGSDGDLTVGSGQTVYVDNVRAAVVGTTAAGQNTVHFAVPTTGEVSGRINLWPKWQWVDTGLRIAAGEKLRVVADPHGHPDLHGICYGGSSGNLCYDANGIAEPAPAGWTAPGIRKFSLVASIGNGAPFFIGSNFDGVVNESGKLYLGLNDCNGCFGDNEYRQGNIGFTFNLWVGHSTTPQFSPGDQVLVLQMTGNGAGNYELATVASAGQGVITLTSPLQHTYTTGGASRAQIIRVPQYRNVVIRNGGVLTSRQWDGSTGGVIAFKVRDQLTVEDGGQISAFANGFSGGREATWSQPDAGPGYQGESYTGAAQAKSRSSNGGGGGGGQNTGGGGGGYGSPGQNGADAPYGFGGETYGAPTLSTIFLGSGGGGTGHVYESAAQGGRGGGIILLIGRSIIVSGALEANGQGGWQGRYSGMNFAPAPPVDSTRDGGGGSGGSIKLIATSLVVGTNKVRAVGGPGGQSTDNGGEGGAGGTGRIRIEYCESLSGSTNPPASTQKLNCYIVEQIESAPYDSARLNLPESFTGGRHYWVQYGRRHVYGGAGNWDTTLRVPAGAFTSATLDGLVSDVGTGSLTFRLDVGNDGSWDWQTTQTVNTAATLNSPDLSAAFSAYWAAHGAPTSGTVDVPVRVYLSKAGQVLLTNLQMTPTGSKLRHVRLPAQDYSSVTLDLTVGESGSGPLTLAADVGDDGAVDWTYTGSPAYPAHLTTANLAAAFNAYLSGHSGEVDAPVRFYIAPFLSLNLDDFDATPSAQPDVTLTESDVAFGLSTPTEGDTVPVTATLHNNGGADTGGLTAAFYAEAPGWGDWYIGSAYVPDVPASGAAQAAIQWNTLGFTGAVPVRVVLDPYGRLAETNETNNEATTTFDILTRPDLLIAHVALSDDEPVVGQIVTATLTVHNTGQTAASGQTVALYQGNPDEGGALVGDHTGPPLSGGATMTVTFTWSPTAPGPYRLFAQADRDDVVNEYDEGNNQVWREVYVGLAGPILLDSGNPAADPLYAAIPGYGAVDTGQPDMLLACGSNPHETMRLDPGGQVAYRFDHLLPGHFYHLDVTLYECDGAGRQESVYVDDNLIAGPENLSDGRIHRLSILLDPALYSDRAISVTIQAPGIDGAVVSQVNLYDIDFRYADCGGADDPQYPVGQDGVPPYGWLDGTGLTTWGSLPYQSVRVDQTDAQVRYQFDGLNAAKSYRVNLTFWQPSGSARIQRVLIDGVDTGVVVNTGDYEIHHLSVDAPASAYAPDGSIVVSIVRTNATIGAMVSEISLEELTLTAEGVPPVADFTASPTSGYAPLTVQFTDRSSGFITSRRWNFGDGASDSVADPLHTYGLPGVYDVALVVSGPGGSDTLTRTGLITVTAIPSDVTIMRLDPAAASAGAGVPITLTVVISNVENLGSFQFTLAYDPALVGVDSVTLGEFPGSSGRTFTPVGPVISNTNGTAVFGAFSLGSTPPGSSGGGPLAYVRLLPRAGGVATLHLQDVQVSSVAGQSIAVLTQDGALSIAACIGDFDGDGDVDILDVQRVAFRWNTHSGDPLYDPLYDLDQDGDIDVLDVQQVAYRWGTRCSGSGMSKSDFAQPGFGNSLGALLGLPRLAGGINSLQQEATLALLPSTRTVQVGQTFTMGVVISDAVDLGAFEFTLGYSPTVVKVASVVLGDFPGSTGRTFTPAGPVISPTAGSVSFGAYSLGAAPEGPNGNGVLAVLTLRALAEGESTMSFRAAQVSDRAGNPQTLGGLTGGRVAVKPGGRIYLPLVMRQ